MKIVFASNNPGKIQELQYLLSNSALTIIPQKEMHVNSVPETGLSFVENAILKARNAASQTGLPAIADDSGLVVPALNGNPGIYSARFAGTNATDAENIEKLLMDLKQVPTEDRNAYFHCSLVYMSHTKDPAPLICEGKWEGYILMKPHGNAGFGYDPVFQVISENKSAAECNMTIKNQLSHRGQALRALLARLSPLIK